MQDEVVLTGASVAGVCFQPSNDLKLVIAREDQVFTFGFLVFLQVNEASEDVKPAIAGPDLLPKIRGLVAIGVGWVSGAVLVALVERKEEGFVTIEPGCHEDLIRVDREMHQGALLEAEDQLVLIAGSFILSDGVVDILAGIGIL